MADLDETSEFRAMITAYREAQCPAPIALNVAQPYVTAQRLRVCVRKRPLLPSETKSGEFDVLSCFGQRAVLHQTRRKVDQERVLENHSFSFDDLFDAGCGTRQVYEVAAKPLVSAVFAGGRATCFAYGATGAGKTHTMFGSPTTPPAVKPPRVSISALAISSRLSSSSSRRRSSSRAAGAAAASPLDRTVHVRDLS